MNKIYSNINCDYCNNPMNQIISIELTPDAFDKNVFLHYECYTAAILDMEPPGGMGVGAGNKDRNTKSNE